MNLYVVALAGTGLAFANLTFALTTSGTTRTWHWVGFVSWIIAAIVSFAAYLNGV